MYVKFTKRNVIASCRFWFNGVGLLVFSRSVGSILKKKEKKITDKEFLCNAQDMVNTICNSLSIPPIKLLFQKEFLETNLRAFYSPIDFTITVSKFIDSRILVHEIQHYQLDLISRCEQWEERLVERATEGSIFSIIEIDKFKNKILNFDKVAMEFTK